MNGPFHPGELQAQALAGVVAAGGGIRDYMPDQHRTFFELLPYLFVATLDAAGAPRARIVTGPAGFVDSPDPVTLRIAAPTGLRAGEAVGILGIDFSTRRRNRANGVVKSNADGVALIAVEQSFGNCPKYIRLRSVREVAPSPAEPRDFDGLDGEAARLVARAETFFIATTGGAYGIDISHRGGPPGFVQIDGDVLTVPDYVGNRYFNTLGNLLLDPRAALLFVDDATGDVLELRGRAEVVWDREASVEGELPRARRWRFGVEGGTLQRVAVPLRWERLE